MLKNDLLIVYGTLRPGERADLRGQLYGYGVTHLGLDKINGKMYSVGTFPGIKDIRAKFDPKAPIIIGDVFKIRHQSITALLDAYEGYNAEHPDKGMYDRVQVETEKGRVAWVYVYNYPVFAEQFIESGDWCRNRHTACSGKRMME